VGQNLASPLGLPVSHITVWLLKRIDHERSYIISLKAQAKPCCGAGRDRLSLVKSALPFGDKLRRDGGCRLLVEPCEELLYCGFGREVPQAITHLRPS
jgi:hypothetical protein